jgi:hypothetical protein
MRSYVPSKVPSDPAELPDFLRREFQAIRKAANAAEPHIQLEVLHAEPEKVFPGMEVNADGTDWDPGSGAGRYYRDEANANWVFLG